jgi:hypothetical protein
MTRADDTVPTPELRVIYASPPLDPLDHDEDARRRAEVYAQSDRAEVAVVDGFGAQVLVERGHIASRTTYSQTLRDMGTATRQTCPPGNARRGCKFR